MRLLFAFMLLCGVAVAGELTSEEERDLARRELAVIGILREYADAQHKFYELNLERGYAPSIPVLVELKYMRDITNCIYNTGGDKKIYGYCFSEDKSFKNTTSDFGLFAFPDALGKDGHYIFWIGKDKVVYEKLAKEIKPLSLEAPWKDWHKVSDPWPKNQVEKPGVEPPAPPLNEDDSSLSAKNNDPAQHPAKEEKFPVTDLLVNRSDTTEMYFIKGVIKNNSGKDYKGGIFNISFFDAGEKLLGTASFVINNFELDEPVTFETTTKDGISDWKTFRTRLTTGY